MKRVSEFAAAKGISRRRAYELVRSGAIPAQQLSDGTVLLEDSAMAWVPRRSRPLSKAMAWALLAALDGVPVPGLRAPERARVRSHISRLALSDSPARDLAEKVSSRADLREYAAHDDDLPALLREARIKLSGVGAKGSGMSGGNIVEGYIARDALEAVQAEHLLDEQPGGNVRLRVVQTLPSIGPAVIAADLADWNGPRELRQADRIIRECLEHK